MVAGFILGRVAAQLLAAEGFPAYFAKSTRNMADSAPVPRWIRSAKTPTDAAGCFPRKAACGVCWQCRWNEKREGQPAP
jgi:hypothetical protein